jgi:hypothetical protein
VPEIVAVLNVEVVVPSTNSATWVSVALAAFVNETVSELDCAMGVALRLVGFANVARWNKKSA